MIARLTRLFPLWALLFAAAAYVWPAAFRPLAPAVVPLLGVVMLGMGVSLTPADFARVLQRPGAVSLGVGLQFLVMPLVAYLVAHAIGLPAQLVAGLVLVGSCPGGTASNVVCYLARGDVALSITLTTVSTLLAVVATPALTWLYVGRLVPVPVADMLLTIVLIVIAPVLAGVAVNRLWGRRLRALKELFPLISVIAIVVIIAIVVALNREALTRIGPPLAAAVIAHNIAGLACGYWLPRAFGAESRLARTLAIEVGMQNSGLGVALAQQFFSTQAAVPGALFSIWHNLSGSVLAGVWARDAGRGSAARDRVASE